MAKYRGSEEQGAQLPVSGGALASRPCAKKQPDKKPRTGRCQDLEETSGRVRQGHRGADGPAPGEPPGADRYLGAGRGRQMGGGTLAR